MRIGPEPITITCWMSVRLGIRLLSRAVLHDGSRADGGPAVPGGLHQVHEALEQRRRVVRAGRGLRVELDAERRRVGQPQALHHVVVEADVADLHRPVGGVGGPVERGVDGEAVVVAGDPHRAADPVQHRLVEPAVAEAQLVGAQAQRAAEDLVAEADAEQRPAGVEHALHRADRVVGGGRVARAVGEEDAVRARGEQLLGGGGRGQHVRLDAELGQVPRGGGLDAEVERGDGEPLLPHRRHDVGLAGADGRGEVGAGHAVGGLHAGQQLPRRPARC